MTGAQTFAAAASKAEAAKAALNAALDDLNTAAQAMARESVIAYSKAHPRRLVTFCAAMGTTTLTVTRSTRRNRHDFDFSERYDARTYRGDVIPPPAFLKAIWTASEDYDYCGLGSNLLFKVQGGVVVCDKDDW